MKWLELTTYLMLASSFICLRFSAGNIHGIHSAAWSPAKWDSYDPVAFRKYYRYQPFLVAHRVILILAEIVMLTLLHWAEKDVHKRAAKVRGLLLSVLLTLVTQSVVCCPVCCLAIVCRDWEGLWTEHFLIFSLSLACVELFLVGTVVVVTAQSHSPRPLLYQGQH